MTDEEKRWLFVWLHPPAGLLLALWLTSLPLWAIVPGLLVAGAWSTILLRWVDEEWIPGAVTQALSQLDDHRHR